MTVTEKPDIRLRVHICLEEAEAVALNELAKYSTEDVLKAISAISPKLASEHERGFRSILEGTRKCINDAAHRAQAARNIFSTANQNTLNIALTTHS